jgi:hypothetical protein
MVRAHEFREGARSPARSRTRMAPASAFTAAPLPGWVLRLGMGQYNAARKL